MSMRVLGQIDEGHVPVDVGPVAPHDLVRLCGEYRWLWVDTVAPDRETLEVIGSHFGVDELAVDDVFDMELLPKLDDYGDHLYVVLHALIPLDHRVDTSEIDIIVTPQALITVHDGDLVGVEDLWLSVQRSRDPEGELDPSPLLGHLAEVVGRRFLEVIVELDRRLEDLADRALLADAGVLAEVQVLRREASTIRTMVQPQRQVLRALVTINTSLVTRAGRGRIRDAAEVHDQLVEGVETARALLSDVLDTYRGAAGEKLAEITTVLTVYAAILLPLSLITGWFGMNHFDLPLIDQRYGWLVVSAGMVAFAVAQWMYFVRRGFVRKPRLNRHELAGLGIKARQVAERQAAAARTRVHEPSRPPGRE